MDTSRKFERTFNWSITKDQAEKYVGPLSDLEFDHFCKVFEEVFYNEYQGTLELFREDWAEFKTWDVD